jgi:hypothetical protein
MDVLTDVLLPIPNDAGKVFAADQKSATMSLTIVFELMA